MSTSVKVPVTCCMCGEATSSRTCAACVFRGPRHEDFWVCSEECWAAYVQREALRLPDRRVAS